MIKKIFEIKSEDWERSMSYETEAFVGGIFKTFSNCNPFVRRGYFQPTPTVVQLGSGTVSTSNVIRSILAYSTNIFYALADDSKIYLIDLSGPTVTNKSSQITATSGSANFIAPYKGGVVYSVNGVVEYNTIPLASGSKVPLMTSGAGNQLILPNQSWAIGADRYLYAGNGNNVARITNITGTSGNTSSVAASLETGYQVQKLINDGRYLVWIANATSSGVVAFWDLAKSVFDQIYEINDYIESAEMVGNMIQLITINGIYLTNIGMRPKLVLPFGGTVSTATEYPQGGGMTAIHQGVLMWGAVSNGKIYAFGNKDVGKNNRLFQPYSISGSAGINAIASDNSNVLASTVISGSVKLYSLTTGLTNSTAIANTSTFSVPQPFVFDHARAVLRTPITSGDSVSLQILSANSTKTILATSEKTNSTDPGEKNLIFDSFAAGDGSDIRVFDDISDLKITTNTAIRSFEVWGEAEDERSSNG